MSRDRAVVVGSGPNGLAGAITLARAGLAVEVYEAAPTVGGGLRSAPLAGAGFVHDVCSTGHPLAVASPFFRSLDLTRHGVEFVHADLPFAHPLDGGDAALAHRSVAATAEGLGADAAAYRRLMGPLVDGYEDLLGTILSPLRSVPLRPAALAVLTRFALRARRSQAALAGSLRTERAAALLTGAAAHSVLPMTALPTTAFGLVLTLLAHAVGWPVVRGGSQALADGLDAELRELGGEVHVGRPIRTLADLPPAAVTLFDVSPRAFTEIAADRLPASYAAALRRYRYGPGVCKVDFALSGPVPWANAGCRRAGTVHLGGRWQDIAESEAAVTASRHPERPYVLAVQSTVADPSRAPAGQHTLWTYCHVPAGSTVDMTDAVTDQVERFAPGFRDLVLARHVSTAAQVEAYDPNYVGGDIATGTTSVLQTLFRPVPRWDVYRTPVRGAYLCSSATAPGPGVHGMCGYLAARSALARELGTHLL